MAKKSKQYVSVYRRSVDTPYLNLIHDSALSSLRHNLQPNPRLAIIDKPMGKAILKSVGYGIAREKILATLPQLNRPLGFIALSTTVIHGQNKNFIALTPDDQTEWSILAEQRQILNTFNTAIARPMARNLIIASFLPDELAALDSAKNIINSELSNKPANFRITLGGPTYEERI